MRQLTLWTALGAMAATGMAGAQTIRTTVDGVPVAFRDVQPMMVHGRVMVPLRGVFEEMGATVQWDPVNRSVTAQVPGTKVVLYEGRNVAWVDGAAMNLDAPPMIVRGRTLVPLRFISESLGNDVVWAADTRTVEIATGALGSSFYNEIDNTMVRIDSRTVIPCRLNGSLDSDTAYRGQMFTATVEPGTAQALGLPLETRVEGHVDAVAKRDGSTPGVLGLAFDVLRLPDGRTAPLYGSLTSLDEDSVERVNGRLVAKNTSKDNLKYVGYGAGGGALIAILSKGNILSSSVIGAALGYLYGELAKKPEQAHDVHLKSGAEFGVRLDKDLVVRTSGN